MSGVVNLSAIETPDLGISPDTQKDVSMFITCWTLLFMCMAIALELTDPQVSNIAEVGEFLKLCLGFTTVMKGGRRRQRGGVDDDEAIGSALATITAKLPSNAVVLKQKIQLVKGQLVEARKKALGKFQEGPSMLNRLVRLLASAGIAFMPIADKLITLGLKLKSEQYKASMAVAAVTAPAQVAAIAVGDAALTALVGVDMAFAAAGKVGVESAAAAGEGIALSLGWFGKEFERVKKSPGTRGEAEKQAAAKVLSDFETLKGWAAVDANFAKVADYEKYFNSTADLLSQQPPQALEIGTDARRARDETEGAQIVKGIRANRKTMDEGVKVLAGFTHFFSPFNTYMFMVAHLFKRHTMTYIKWSNVLGMTIAGIVAEDPVTVVLCITWVMSALVGVSWVARLLDALTAQVEVKTSLDMERASAAALELKHLEDELKTAEKLQAFVSEGSAAPSTAAAAPAATAGRRSTSRRRRRAAYLPRQTRRSSSGRRRGYSRRQRG